MIVSRQVSSVGNVARMGKNGLHRVALDEGQEESSEKSQLRNQK